ncbi:MAG: sensory rhodopsin transducer [Chloroflexota bacterium]|nr:sensory rhodopsin transducer [Chloroflexota bacterium]
MHTRYLIDFEYLFDAETGFAMMGHLLAFNLSGREAALKVTIYFEDAEPATFDLTVPAGQCVETNYEHWPIAPNQGRFALQVDSTEPVVCQATVGWNNAWNNYAPDTVPLAPEGLRECAKSYLAHERLSRESGIADGVVLDNPNAMWVRESEWAVLLNPGPEPANVTLALHFDEPQLHQVVVPPRRLVSVYMDDLVPHNKHYGVRFASDQPIAAQWLRSVNWYHRPDLMAFWSVPAVPVS